MEYSIVAQIRSSSEQCYCKACPSDERTLQVNLFTCIGNVSEIIQVISQFIYPDGCMWMIIKSLPATLPSTLMS